jgi:hypothetical protein
MKRLRHPVRAIREPFGTAGLVVACVALIAALGGTALAAAKLTSTQKKEVAKIAKKFAGKPGKPGAPGAQGPVGPAGKDGANGAPGSQGPQGATGVGGATGKTGATGATGSEGAAGESPKAVATFTGAEEETLFGTGEHPCNGAGGGVYEVESTGESSNVCNGLVGAPWSPNSELPAGAMERGAWGFTTNESQGEVFVALSFPIMLPKPALDGSHVHFETETNFSDFDEGGSETIGCTGTGAVPKAPPGHLCVFKSEYSQVTYGGIYGLGFGPGANRTGALLKFTTTGTAAEPARGGGSFAVKAACNTGETIVKEGSGPTAEFICQKP